MYYEDRKLKVENLKEKIENLSAKISNREEQIASLILSNNNSKVKLEKLLLLVEKEEELLKPKPQHKHTKNQKLYSNFDNCSNENIGLNNSTVLFPVAECKLHKCYLSYQHVRKRKCVMKMCKHLEWINERTEI